MVNGDHKELTGEPATSLEAYHDDAYCAALYHFSSCTEIYQAMCDYQSEHANRKLPKASSIAIINLEDNDEALKNLLQHCKLTYNVKHIKIEHEIFNVFKVIKTSWDQLAHPTWKGLLNVLPLNLNVEDSPTWKGAPNDSPTCAERLQRSLPQLEVLLLIPTGKLEVTKGPTNPSNMWWNYAVPVKKTASMYKMGPPQVTDLLLTEPISPTSHHGQVQTTKEGHRLDLRLLAQSQRRQEPPTKSRTTNGDSTTEDFSRRITIPNECCNLSFNVKNELSQTGGLCLATRTSLYSKLAFQKIPW
eukprot:jgi/Psemu1/39998/gm1.39998_g